MGMPSNLLAGVSKTVRSTGRLQIHGIHIGGRRATSVSAGATMRVASRMESQLQVLQLNGARGQIPGQDPNPRIVWTSIRRLLAWIRSNTTHASGVTLVPTAGAASTKATKSQVPSVVPPAQTPW